MSRTNTACLLALAALLGGSAQAQYANGEEAPVRPEPPAAGSIHQEPADDATQASAEPATKKRLRKPPKPAATPAENLPTGDNIDAYTAAQIVAQAQAASAAKEAEAAATTAPANPGEAPAHGDSATEATAAESATTAAADVPTDAQTSGDDNVALLPVEKLSPPPEPPPPTETVVVEQAIYRCPKGKSYIYVDGEKRKGYSRCTLFRAEKTEEVPVGSAPASAAPVSGNPNNCSGTLQYKGSTYLFMEHQPCPIPDSIFQRLTPAATSH